MKRGFTLIEFLGVIVILGILVFAYFWILDPQFTKMAEERRVEWDRIEAEQEKKRRSWIEQEKVARLQRLESKEIGDNLFWTEARATELSEALELLSLKGYKILRTELISQTVIKHKTVGRKTDLYNVMEPTGYLIYTEKTLVSPNEKPEKE